jgi:Methylase involved in ubiquinone/menaquinone biosynthesis
LHHPYHRAIAVPPDRTRVPMKFTDMFSERARMYSQYRPEYPAELFSWIATLTERHAAVWDCATGNGQAAKALAGIFDRVIATDASAEQIANAVAGDRIEYRVANASQSGLPDASVSMVTVAQALHWLDPDSFYPEVKRVLEPGGALVVWGYGDPVMETDDLEKIVHSFNRGTIENYWTPQRQLLLENIRISIFRFVKSARRSSISSSIGHWRSWLVTCARGRRLRTMSKQMAPTRLKRSKPCLLNTGVTLSGVVWLNGRSIFAPDIQPLNSYCFAGAAAASGNRTKRA